jgi:hypothetical protein
LTLHRHDNTHLVSNTPRAGLAPRPRLVEELYADPPPDYVWT